MDTTSVAVRVTLFVLAGILLLIFLVVWWPWLFGSRTRSPEVLAEIALTGSTPQERETAAAELSALGTPAVESMRRVLRESQLPEIRATMIAGLAQRWDFDSMPAFLDALDSDSLLVRSRAAGAVQRLLQIDFGYRPEDSHEQRQRTIKAFRDEWEKMRVTPALKKFREKLKQKGF